MAAQRSEEAAPSSPPPSTFATAARGLSALSVRAWTRGAVAVLLIVNLAVWGPILRNRPTVAGDAPPAPPPPRRMDAPRVADAPSRADADRGSPPGRRSEADDRSVPGSSSPSSERLPLDASTPPPGAPGLGPVDTSLGIVLLQSEPSLTLDAEQRKAVLAAAQEARGPLQVAYGGLLELRAALRPAQIAHLNRNRPSGSAEAPRMDDTLAFLEKRAAEGGGTLPSASGGGGDDLHLSLNELAGVPQSLEADATLRLDAAQATAVRGALLKLRDIEGVETRFSTRVTAVLRSDQRAFLEARRARLDAIRQLVPLWLLARSLGLSPRLPPSP